MPIYIGTTDGNLHDFAGLDVDVPVLDAPSQWSNSNLYAQPNYAALLGTVDAPEGNGSWVEASDFGLLDTHPLRAGGGEAFLYQGTWTSGLPSGEWVYAMADLDGDGVFDKGKDDFSPPTMSTVPEPATLILLGSGLLGLAAFRRRKLKKSLKAAH